MTINKSGKALSQAVMGVLGGTQLEQKKLKYDDPKKQLQLEILISLIQSEERELLEKLLEKRQWYGFTLDKKAKRIEVEAVPIQVIEAELKAITKKGKR